MMFQKGKRNIHDKIFQRKQKYKFQHMNTKHKIQFSCNKTDFFFASIWYFVQWIIILVEDLLENITKFLLFFKFFTSF